MDKKEKLEKIKKLIQNTMISNIGIEVIDMGDDFVCGKMPVDNRTIQSFGILHGGASVALAESLGSIAGSMKIDKNNEVVIGIEINANHLKSVEKGWVYGKASPVKIGKKIQVWEILITDQDNKKVCISRLTLAVVKKS
jgi:1,4-dihydroxy-2-naphthoyl-CoA hydrolase